jgi:hypothetical protein
MALCVPSGQVGQGAACGFGASTCGVSGRPAVGATCQIARLREDRLGGGWLGGRGRGLVPIIRVPGEGDPRHAQMQLTAALVRTRGRAARCHRSEGQAPQLARLPLARDPWRSPRRNAALRRRRAAGTEGSLALRTGQGKDAREEGATEPRTGSERANREWRDGGGAEPAMTGAEETQPVPEKDGPAATESGVK